jgi:small subunit ribosomal protein S20
LANHKSAIKRARQNIDRRTRNKSAKTRVKNVITDVRLAVRDKSKERAQETLTHAKSIIDKTARKGIIHKNSAARKISRLSKLVNNLTP